MRGKDRERGNEGIMLEGREGIMLRGRKEMKRVNH